ncbi:MAG: amidohydrolase family protein [Anaplasmataceae bacterium]|nr:amidohydrolase family protein [Anaplasmataceae bacterium]MBS3903616.1 amidohydrolase family protein [Anaplasmataceae bacterium]
MIIDSHVHIGLTDHHPPLKSKEEGLEKLLREAKGAKVSHLIVIAGFKDRDPYDGSTSEVLRLTKDVKNISVVGSVNVIRYTKAQLQALEVGLEKKQIAGIKIYTGYQHIYPNDKRCLPLYKLCLKYDVPVIFHSGDTLPGYVQNPKIKYSHPIHIDEVATDLPDLKIIIAHMGNPWLIDCAEILYKNPNVYADVSGVILGEDFKHPYSRLVLKRIEELIHYSESHKLLFGTDWPLCRMKSQIAFAKKLPLSKNDFEKLFFRNAANLFRIRI